MRRPLIAVLIACALMIGFQQTPALAASEHPNPSIKWGVIDGVVELCTQEDPSGLLVYVEGWSFLAKTDPSGFFRLVYVPTGEYTLVIERDGEVLAVLEDVPVQKWRFTNLGTIQVCPDADGDGFDALEDCDDSDPNVFPGATELCDNIDNDCDLDVDEDFDLFTDPNNCGSCGTVCEPGEQCIDGACVGDGDGDGFNSIDDCDDTNPNIFPGATEVCDSLDNDCDSSVDEDFDLQTDSNNCGSCGTVCGAGEICSAGSCVPEAA